MRGIYILPNLMTAMNLSCGFWAVFLLLGSDGTAVGKAAWLIILANVFDILDGRLARWTKTSSQFGAEFDSLADLVAFGVAPALLVVKHALGEYGPWGGAVGLAFVLCGALRLARFNVQAQSATESTYFFVGCPIPAAATLLVSCVLYDLNNNLSLPAKLYAVMGIVAALIMVSNFPYPSLKKNRRGKKARLVVKLVLLGIVTFAFLTYKEGFIFLVALCYWFSGILWKLGRLLQRFVPARFRRDKVGPEEVSP